MDFTLTKDQEEICQAVKEFCIAQLNKDVFKDDEAARFPREKWDGASQFGIQGLPFPEEYGGLGLDMLSTALAIEALSTHCQDEGLIFSILAHMCTCSLPILHFGTDEQKASYLPKLVSGEHIGGNGISEAQAGSDSASIQTSVVKDDRGYTIKGAKIFVTNGPVADLLIIYARHPKGMKMLDVSGFIIEKDNPRMSTGQLFEKMGLRTSTICEIVLDNCSVDASCLLGRERLGIQVFNASMIWERILMAAYHVGAMEQQYGQVVAYANTREQYGNKIVSYGKISDKIINMKMRLEHARLLLYKVCWEYDQGKRDLVDAAMLKLAAAEGKVNNSLDAVQIFGAYGFMKESHAEKQIRDSLAAKIYSGTSEIQRKIIAESLGG